MTLGDDKSNVILITFITTRTSRHVSFSIVVSVELSTQHSSIVVIYRPPDCFFFVLIDLIEKAFRIYFQWMIPVSNLILKER